MAPMYPWVSVPVANAAWVPITRSAATARMPVSAGSRYWSTIGAGLPFWVPLPGTSGLANTASSVAI